MCPPLAFGLLSAAPDLGPRVMCAVAGTLALFLAARPGPFSWGRLGSPGPRMPTPLARGVAGAVALGFFLMALFGKGMTLR